MIIPLDMSIQGKLLINMNCSPGIVEIFGQTDTSNNLIPGIQ
jgi:hypothetical protein